MRIALGCKEILNISARASLGMSCAMDPSYYASTLFPCGMYIFPSGPFSEEVQEKSIQVQVRLHLPQQRMQSQHLEP